MFSVSLAKLLFLDLMSQTGLSSSRSQYLNFKISYFGEFNIVFFGKLGTAYFDHAWLQTGRIGTSKWPITKYAVAPSYRQVVHYLCFF